MKRTPYTVELSKSASVSEGRLNPTGRGEPSVFRRSDNDPDSRTCRVKRMMMTEDQARNLNRETYWSAVPWEAPKPKKVAAKKTDDDTSEE